MPISIIDSDSFSSVYFPQCFFPQNLIANIKTPLFLLNAAYDAWQVRGFSVLFSGCNIIAVDGFNYQLSSTNKKEKEKNILYNNFN